MDRFVITGFGEYDGEYDFAPPFNIREWRWLRKLADTTPETLVQRYDARDPDLLVAFAVIAMCRDGKIRRDEWEQAAEAMCETPLDGATLTLVAEEADTPLEESTRPPTVPSQSSQSEKLPPNVQRLKPSGESSTNGSETSDATLAATTGMRSGTC